MGQHTPGPWVEMHGLADNLGRIQHTVYWVADYHPGHPNGEHRTDVRGQVFFCNPADRGHERYAKWPGKDAARAAIAKATT